MSMLLLDPQNKLLAETCDARLNWSSEIAFCDKDFYNVKLCDFDDASYEIKVPEGTTDLRILTTLPAFKDIKDTGGKASLEKRFGSAYLPDDEDADIVLSYDIKDRETMDEKKKAELIKDISLVKAYAIGGVFEHFFGELNKGNKPDPFKFNLRGDTEVFFAPGSDRVTVIFGLSFMDDVDKVLAKIFMQEFQEAQKKVPRAPPCRFSIQPPNELVDQFDVKENTGILGYVSFGVQTSHVSKPENMEKVVFSFLGFRTYLQYHIKCSKSFFHSRMRLRAKELLKVLNRAKIQTVDDKAKGKKDIHGKRFVRK